MIKGLLLTKLVAFPSKEGAVCHGIKSSDPGYVGFGELYFSFVENNTIKAWKLHQKMTLNLVVPTGVVRFNFIDLREQSDTYKERVEITLSIDNYLRITVPPKILFGFKGLGDGSNIVANIADMVHADEECINININKYEFK